MEANLVQRAGIAFESIPAAGLHGVGPKSLPKNILQLMAGFVKSRRILKEFKPDVLFFTGGYVAVPMALAGRRFPSLLFVPDIEPGLALKSITRFADVIAIPNEESISYFKKTIVEKHLKITGYPTRSELSLMKKEDAQKHFHLIPDIPTLLVFGGSKGAQSINRALLPLLPTLLNRFQIIHISGNYNWEEVNEEREKLPESLLKNYHAFPYLHEKMSAALRSADLIISRAGASILGEYPIIGTPAILVPYPFAWRYQKVNAEYLVSKNAAILLPDEEMPEKLLDLINDLFDQPDKLELMRQSLRKLRQPQAAKILAQQLQILAKRK